MPRLGRLGLLGLVFGPGPEPGFGQVVHRYLWDRSCAQGPSCQARAAPRHGRGSRSGRQVHIRAGSSCRWAGVDRLGALSGRPRACADRGGTGGSLGLCVWFGGAPGFGLGHPCYEPSPPSGPETREERSAWPRARLPVEMYLNLGDAGRLREAVGEAPNGRSSNWRDLVPTGQRRKTAGAKGLDYHGPGVGGVHGGSCGGSGVQLRQEGGQGCCEALFVGELATRGIQLGSSSRVTHT